MQGPHSPSLASLAPLRTHYPSLGLLSDLPSCLHAFTQAGPHPLPTAHPAPPGNPGPASSRFLPHGVCSDLISMQAYPSAALIIPWFPLLLSLLVENPPPLVQTQPSQVTVLPSVPSRGSIICLLPGPTALLSAQAPAPLLGELPACPGPWRHREQTPWHPGRASSCSHLLGQFPALAPP